MSDIYYKTKYLKYKAKYFNLLKGGVINEEVPDISEKSNGIPVTFKVISNSGRIGTYTNQCLWISIMDYLNKVLIPKPEPEITIEQIRGMGSPQDFDIPINDTNEFFDTVIHHASLQNILLIFNLNIKFYLTTHVQIDGQYTYVILKNTPEYTVGDITSPNILSIVHYGNHFELITEIDGKKLYENPSDPSIYSSSQNYELDREAFVGKSINISISISKDGKYENKINNIIEIIGKLNFSKEYLINSKKDLENKIKQEINTQKITNMSTLKIKLENQLKANDKQRKNMNDKLNDLLKE